MHPAAVAGLSADGLASAGEPIMLSESDLRDAFQVVIFSELPDSYRVPEGTQLWTVPAVSEDYARSRSAIVSRIELLIEELSD
jgi:hypothetical protein